MRQVFGLLAGLVALAAAGPKDDIAGLIRSLKPGNPVVHKNLTVFPLTGNSTGSGAYVLLDKAIADGDVEVQEKEGGEVNTVRVRNTSKKYVFGMAGQIITGAKQNRMLGKDIILPPGSGWLDVSVYCVEHGRWSGVSMEFGSKGQIAAGRVRAKAANTQSQSGVWDEVQANNAELGIVTESDRFDAVFDDSKVQAGLGGYQKELEKKLPKLAPNAVGVAVAVGDRIVCCDVFSTPALFQKLWPRLLESYVIDAMARTPEGKTGKADISAFLADAAGAEMVAQQTVGAGKLYRVEGDEATGSAIVRSSEVVHLDLFPSEETGGTPFQLDIRRQNE